MHTYADKKIPAPESVSELYRLSDRRLSAKLMPTFAEKGCRVVSVTDPYGRILGYTYNSNYYKSLKNWVDNSSETAK
jgi:YD repeat-containing protein